MSDDNSNNTLSDRTVQGGIVNIGGTNTFQGSVTVTLGNLSSTVGAMSAAQDDKAALQKLIIED